MIALEPRVRATDRMIIGKDAVMNKLLVALFVITALAGCSRSNNLDDSHTVKWYLAHDAAAYPSFLVGFLGSANSNNNHPPSAPRKPEA
jgi:hypothetical protein